MKTSKALVCLIGLSLVCVPVFAQSPWVDAMVTRSINGTVAAGLDSSAGDALFPGFYSWGFGMFSHYLDPLTTPKVTVSSTLTGVTGQWGAAPSGPLTFPLTASDTTLAPNGAFTGSIVATNVPGTFQPGYASSRTVDPVVVPANGSVDQTVTVTVRFTDAARWAAGTNDKMFGTLGVTIWGSCQSITPFSNPAGGPYQEPWGPTCDKGNMGQIGGAHWDIQWNADTNQLGIGQAYTFTAVIQADNAASSPVLSKPYVQLTAEINYAFSQETGGMTDVFDTVLNGNFEFALDQAVLWQPRAPAEFFEVDYPGVTVADTTPPAISGMPAGGCTLWPPNNKLVEVATISASAGISGLSSFNVTATSNEPANPGPDIVIKGAGLQPRDVQLRAQRLGNGNGRIYTITATAANGAGLTSTSTAVCTVPHDQGK